MGVPMTSVSVGQYVNIVKHPLLCHHWTNRTQSLFVDFFGMGVNSKCPSHMTKMDVTPTFGIHHLKPVRPIRMKFHMKIPNAMLCECKLVQKVFVT